MPRLLAGLLRLPKPWALSLYSALAGVHSGVMDYATGYDLQVTAFYLIPICWASWAAGRKAWPFSGGSLHGDLDSRGLADK